MREQAAEVCRRHGISDATFYNWKARYGGLEVSQARRLKALEDEDARLKELLVESMLGNAVLKELAAKRWRPPLDGPLLPVRARRMGERAAGASGAVGTRAPLALPGGPNQRWSLDFVSDILGNGRRFRILAVVDDFTRECLALVTDTSLTAPMAVAPTARMGSSHVRTSNRRWMKVGAHVITA